MNNNFAIGTRLTICWWFSAIFFPPQVEPRLLYIIPEGRFYRGKENGLDETRDHGASNVARHINGIDVLWTGHEGKRAGKCDQGG